MGSIFDSLANSGKVSRPTTLFRWKQIPRSWRGGIASLAGGSSLRSFLMGSMAAGSFLRRGRGRIL